jgi:hypothetical protein
MCWRKEKEAAVVDRRQAGSEAAVEAELLALVDDELLDALPLDPERRVGEHVVERAAAMAVVIERVALDDVRRVLALEHHVRATDGVGLLVQLLPEDLEPRLRVELPEVVLGHGEHPAGPAGGVEERLDDPRFPEHLVVLDEEQVDHEPDHLARGEVLSGRLVRELRELPDELLVQVAHLHVRDDVRMQVDLRELRDDEVEQVRAFEPGDLGIEAELVDHVAGARREPRDV